MKLLPAPAYFVVMLGMAATGLAGCADFPVHLDPLNVQRGAGGGKEPSYDALMHIADVARASGDLPNAVSVYRHAAAVAPRRAEPFAKLGDTLLEMGSVNEAIRTYNSALERDGHNPDALRGLAKAYLKTGRPELADKPLSTAYQDAPNDPKVLLLIGVANDYNGQHREAQKRYRQALGLRPGDPALTIDLALSLALTENYPEAIALLRPLATGPGGTPAERQTLALIYGLQGDRRQAEQLARADLDAASVQHNLAFYETLRKMSPNARSRAVISASTDLAASPST
ncbi:MAG TPA: tetratricopeptide repeat protein [Stellaceae bacterium]|nr:tetratricopeptide repeat protein [Stellaceae bacterium]